MSAYSMPTRTEAKVVGVDSTAAAKAGSRRASAGEAGAPVTHPPVAAAIAAGKVAKQRGACCSPAASTQCGSAVAGGRAAAVAASGAGAPARGPGSVGSPGAAAAGRAGSSSAVAVRASTARRRRDGWPGRVRTANGNADLLPTGPGRAECERGYPPGDRTVTEAVRPLRHREHSITHSRTAPRRAATPPTGLREPASGGEKLDTVPPVGRLGIVRRASWGEAGKGRMSLSSTSSATRSATGQRAVRAATAVAVAVALLTPVAVLFAQIWSGTGDRLAFAADERRGAAYLGPLTRLLSVTTDAQSRAVSGKPVDPAPVRAAIAEVDQVDARLGDRLRTTERWTTIRTIVQDRTGHAWPRPTEAYTQYSDLVTQLMELNRKVGDASRLILD